MPGKKKKIRKKNKKGSLKLPGLVTTGYWQTLKEQWDQLASSHPEQIQVQAGQLIAQAQSFGSRLPPEKLALLANINFYVSKHLPHVSVIPIDHDDFVCYFYLIEHVLSHNETMTLFDCCSLKELPSPSSELNLFYSAIIQYNQSFFNTVVTADESMAAAVAEDAAIKLQPPNDAAYFEIYLNLAKACELITLEHLTDEQKHLAATFIIAIIVFKQLGIALTPAMLSIDHLKSCLLAYVTDTPNQTSIIPITYLLIMLYHELEPADSHTLDISLLENFLIVFTQHPLQRTRVHTQQQALFDSYFTLLDTQPEASSEAGKEWRKLFSWLKPAATKEEFKNNIENLLADLQKIEPSQFHSIKVLVQFAISYYLKNVDSDVHKQLLNRFDIVFPHLDNPLTYDHPLFREVIFGYLLNEPIADHETITFNELPPTQRSTLYTLYTLAGKTNNAAAVRLERSGEESAICYLLEAALGIKPQLITWKSLLTNFPSIPWDASYHRILSFLTNMIKSIDNDYVKHKEILHRFFELCDKAEQQHNPLFQSHWKNTVIDASPPSKLKVLFKIAFSKALCSLNINNPEHREEFNVFILSAITHKLIDNDKLFKFLDNCATNQEDYFKLFKLYTSRISSACHSSHSNPNLAQLFAFAYIFMNKLNGAYRERAASEYEKYKKIINEDMQLKIAILLQIDAAQPSPIIIIPEPVAQIAKNSHSKRSQRCVTLIINKLDTALRMADSLAIDPKLQKHADLFTDTTAKADICTQVSEWLTTNLSAPPISPDRIENLESLCRICNKCLAKHLEKQIPEKANKLALEILKICNSSAHTSTAWPDYTVSEYSNFLNKRIFIAKFIQFFTALIDGADYQEFFNNLLTARFNNFKDLYKEIQTCFARYQTESTPAEEPPSTTAATPTTPKSISRKKTKRRKAKKAAPSMSISPTQPSESATLAPEECKVDEPENPDTAEETISPTESHIVRRMIDHAEVVALINNYLDKHKTSVLAQSQSYVSLIAALANFDPELAQHYSRLRQEQISRTPVAAEDILEWNLQIDVITQRLKNFPELYVPLDQALAAYYFPIASWQQQLQRLKLTDEEQKQLVSDSRRACRFVSKQCGEDTFIAGTQVTIPTAASNDVDIVSLVASLDEMLQARDRLRPFCTSEPVCATDFSWIKLTIQLESCRRPIDIVLTQTGRSFTLHHSLSKRYLGPAAAFYNPNTSQLILAPAQYAALFHPEQPLILHIVSRFGPEMQFAQLKPQDMLFIIRTLFKFNLHKYSLIDASFRIAWQKFIEAAGQDTIKNKIITALALGYAKQVLQDYPTQLEYFFSREILDAAKRQAAQLSKQPKLAGCTSTVFSVPSPTSADRSPTPTSSAPSPTSQC